MLASPKASSANVTGKLKAFFGKENLELESGDPNGNRATAISCKAPATSPFQTAVVKVPLVPKKARVGHENQFSLKLIKVDSPRDVTASDRDSPHFAQTPAAVPAINSTVHPFYRALRELIPIDRELICMKNVLCNRNSSIREKQQQTLSELEALLPKSHLQVSFEEFDPFLKTLDQQGNIIVPTASGFVAAYGKAEAAFDKLFTDCTQSQLQQLFSTLDYNNKGHADIYDFAREAQLNLGGTIKPSHVYLAVKRLSNQGCRVTLSDLLDAAGKRNRAQSPETNKEVREPTSPDHYFGLH